MDTLTSFWTGQKTEWMIASVCMAALSTIVYNLLKDRILEDAKPPRWNWWPLPLWILAWMFKDTAAIGVVIALIWLSYKVRYKRRTTCAVATRKS